MGINLGPHNVVREVPGPRTYEVTTGDRYLRNLENGEIGYLPERHVIMIDETTGRVMIDGGYGTFAYCWPSYGRGDTSLHAFLWSLGFDYFMNKASTKPYMEADIPATFASMKRDLLRDRRRGDFEKDKARVIWDILVEDLHEHMTEHEFTETLLRDGTLYEHYCDGGPHIVTRENGAMRRFWDEVWETFRREVLASHAETERARKAETTKQAA